MVASKLGHYRVEIAIFGLLALAVLAYVILLPLVQTTTGFTVNATALRARNLSYIFCSGSSYDSLQNLSYYAPISSGGIGQWTKTTSFPTPMTNVSTRYAGCSIYFGYVYCMGSVRSNIGHLGYYSNTNTSYYAPIGTKGIGAWKATSSYPFPFLVAGCSAYKSYIYCLGGSGYEPNGDNDVPFALFAQITNDSGLGNWTPTTPYPSPFYDAGCSIYEGYIYCVGNGDHFISHNQTYFAQLSSGGIGNWTATTPYPVSMYGAGCSIYNGYIYCVGTEGTESRNQTYFAEVNSTGIGQWTETTPYPISMYNAGCSISNGYIYCVGTQGTATMNQSYFAKVSSSGIGQWKETTSYPKPIYGQYCEIPGSGGGYLGGGGPAVISMLGANATAALSGKNATGVRALNLSMLFRDPT
jgi:hypothetical protein